MISSGPVFTDHRWLSLNDHTIGVYNALDCIATARIRSHLTDEMRDNGQLHHYRTVYWPFVQHILTLQKRGILLDKERLSRYAKQVSEEVTECEFQVYRATNQQLNFNSPKQLATLLYDTLGLRCHKKTPTGGQSTDQEALDRCLRQFRKKDEHARPVLHQIFHRSRLSTIRDRYFNLPTASDGRVYPTIKAGKVETLRLAYAEPALQQIPEECRHIFVPKPGHVFVSLDYRQLEPSILAVLSEDGPALEVRRLGWDMHAANTRDLLNLTLEGWDSMEPHPRKGARNMGKAFILGISYGGKAETIKVRLFCPCKKCEDKVPNTLELNRNQMKEAEERWFQKHPAVKVFHAELARIAQLQGLKKSYTTRFGYKRIFFSPYNDVLTELLNFPQQANAAGLMNERLGIAMNAGLPVMLQMHDELMLESPRERALADAAQLKEIMEAPVRQMDGAIFPVDVAIGDDWGHLEEVTL